MQQNTSVSDIRLSDQIDDVNSKENADKQKMTQTQSQYKFGLPELNFYPKSFNFMLKPPIFMTFFATYIFCRSLATSGYLPAVISTMEKRFNFTTATSGFIISAYDIGSLISVIFVSYYGGKGHRMRWISIGALVCGIATLIFATPHWMQDTHEYKTSLLGSDNIDINKFICSSNGTLQTKEDLAQCEARGKDVDSDDSKKGYLALFIIMNLLIGIGSSPIQTLGTAFVYDNIVNPQIYVGIVYVMGALGPAAGYLVSGGILRIYVHPSKDSRLDEDNENFMGAWWMGFTIFGSLVLLSAVPLFFYPNGLPQDSPFAKGNSEGDNDHDKSESRLNEKSISEIDSLPRTTRENTPISRVQDQNQNQTETQEDDRPRGLSYGESLIDIPKTIFRLLKNKIFLFVTLSATCEFTIIQAFTKYVPKYLASQFSIAASTSAILAGAVVVPSAGIGIVAGSFILKKWKISATGCTKFIMISSTLAIIFFIPTLFLSCKTLPIASLSEKKFDKYMPACNENCGCLLDDDDKFYYDPVCYLDEGITFYNPCAAGCLTALKVDHTNKTTSKKHKIRDRGEETDGEYEFTDCACLGDPDVRLTQGECDRDCSIWPFLIALFVVTLVTTSGQTPAVSITMHSVKQEDRPLALGVQFLIWRALAYVPTPIYFGRLIDQACLMESLVDYCSDEKGACELYDSEEFRYLYFGLACGVKLLGLILMTICFYYSRIRDREESEKDDTIGKGRGDTLQSNVTQVTDLTTNTGAPGE